MKSSLRRFYEKHEVWFAVLWIVIYCLISVNVPGGSDSYWCILFLTVIAALIAIGVKAAGASEKYGLTFWPKNQKRFLYFIPLWVAVSSILWAGVSLQCTGLKLVCSIFSMLLVGFNEEILFRGFLFKALVKEQGLVTAVAVSSITFGLGHIINLFTAADTLATLLQIINATAWGFLFTMVFCKSRSLWPCIIAHTLVDVFSYFERLDLVMSWVYMGTVIVVGILYGIYLARLPEPEEEPAAPAE